MAFGDIIKRARKGRFSQQTLGEQIGVWGTYIGQIEKVERIPSDERCVQLARALDLEPQPLLIAAYRERAQAKEAVRLFSQIDKLLSDPVISRFVSEPGLLDASLLSGLEQAGVRKALKDAAWQQALIDAADVPDRDIPQLVGIIKQMSRQQWEALLTTAKAMAGIN